MLGMLLKNNGANQFALLTVLVVICLIFVLKRMFRAAIGAFILAVTVPLFLSILLGDGTEYMKRLTSFLPEHRRELIMDAYDYYRDKEKTGPAFDYQAAKTALERLETQIDRRRETGKTEQNMGDQDLLNARRMGISSSVAHYNPVTERIQQRDTS